MKREYEDYLRDMLENAEKALSFVQGLDYDDFCKDDKALYAVIRALEIIGEAARQVPEKVRENNPETPWRGDCRNAEQADSRIFWCQYQSGLADSA